MKTATSLTLFAWLFVYYPFTLQASESAKVSPTDVSPAVTWDNPTIITNNTRDALFVTKNRMGREAGLSFPLWYFDQLTEDYFQKELRRNQLDIDATNDDGETLLMQACKYNHVRAVQTLCRCRANTNIPDNFGNTPLLAQCNLIDTADNNLTDIAIVTCLLEHGANIDGKIGKAWPRFTPLYLMLKAGRTDIAEFLQANYAHLGKNERDSLATLQRFVYLSDEVKLMLLEYAMHYSRCCW